MHHHCTGSQTISSTTEMALPGRLELNLELEHTTCGWNLWLLLHNGWTSCSCPLLLLLLLQQHLSKGVWSQVV